MIPTDSLSPYLLASMHPMMHLTMLFSAMVLVSLDQNGFYENAGVCPEGTPAYKFMNGGKTQLMFTIMTAHLICVVLHVLKYVLLKNHKFWGNLALVAKVAIYLYGVLFVQSGITYDDCNDVTDNMPVMIWLTYEVIAFYLNLFSVIFFLIISTFVQFKTIRDRKKLAGNMRTKMDFLRYAYDDLHWWQLWFTQLGLYAAGLAFRQ